MSNKKFVSMVCFVRSTPRPGTTRDFLGDLNGQRMKCREAGIKGTYLFQYDSLCKPEFQEVIRDELAFGSEIGAWFEFPKCLIVDAGVEWHGREGWDWDFHVRPAFSPAYTMEEKKKIIDTYMKKFYEVVGEYPKCVCSWLLDSDSMKYIADTYKPDLFSLCRDQWGMDGYTLWGGPYYGGYYPCLNNALCPAKTKENQIDVPVFKIYINDPIYAYMDFEHGAHDGAPYGVFTQEPSYAFVGGNPVWTQWEWDTLFKNYGEGYAYVELGQEAGFPLTNFKDSFYFQVDYTKEKQDELGYEIVTFGEMGRRFKNDYATTPTTVRTAFNDWYGLGHQSVWFNNNNYRVNLMRHEGKFYITDIHLFDENYRDKYLDNPCETAAATYDCLPVVDGARFTGEDGRGRIHLGMGELKEVKKEDGNTVVYCYNKGKLAKMSLLPDRIVFEGFDEFEFEYGKTGPNSDSVKEITGNKWSYCHNGFQYSVDIEKEEGKVTILGLDR